MSRFQTDALNPSALPSAILGQRRRPQQSGTGTTSAFLNDGASASLPLGQRNDLELDKVAEAWNVRIDKEVKAVVGGLKDIVTMADIGTNPHAHTPQTTSLHLKLLTSSLIRSAQSLRDIAHELKLTLILGDEADQVRRRDEEAKQVREEIKVSRREVGRLVASLGADSGSTAASRVRLGTASGLNRGREDSGLDGELTGNGQRNGSVDEDMIEEAGRGVGREDTGMHQISRPVERSGAVADTPSQRSGSDDQGEEGEDDDDEMEEVS